MIDIPFFEIVKPPFSDGAIERNDFPGFREDYLVLHSLIRKYKPATFMEIGTCDGQGARLIVNAMEGRPVWTVDLCGTEGRPRVGSGYTQLFRKVGDWAKIPHVEGWFIDGNHEFDGVDSDNYEAFENEARLIIWHDMQIEAVADSVSISESVRDKHYDFFRVPETRIAYAVRKDVSK